MATIREDPDALVRRTTSEDGETENWWFYCEGCESHHAYRTKKPKGAPGPIWTFNGDPIKPTFRASLLCNKDVARPEEGLHRCHLYVTDGMVRYLNDCTHHLKGKTVPVSPPCF